jgi:hypothetical protein
VLTPVPSWAKRMIDRPEAEEFARPTVGLVGRLVGRRGPDDRGEVQAARRGIGQPGVTDLRRGRVRAAQRPFQGDRGGGDPAGLGRPVAEGDHILGGQRIANPERRLIERDVGAGLVGPQPVRVERGISQDAQRSPLDVGTDLDAVEVILLRTDLPARRDVIARAGHQGQGAGRGRVGLAVVGRPLQPERTRPGQRGGELAAGISEDLDPIGGDDVIAGVDLDPERRGSLRSPDEQRAGPGPEELTANKS